MAQSATVTALLLAALALLAMVLAYWTWAWLGPRQESRVQFSAEPAGRLTDAGGMFGTEPVRPPGTAATGLAISLMGVVAGIAGQPGYALIRVDARQMVSVRAGDPVSPGVRLWQVFPDHVVIERNGTRETLAWPERGNPAIPLATDTRK